MAFRRLVLVVCVYGFGKWVLRVRLGSIVEWRVVGGFKLLDTRYGRHFVFASLFVHCGSGGHMYWRHDWRWDCPVCLPGLFLFFFLVDSFTAVLFVSDWNGMNVLVLGF